MTNTFILRSVEILTRKKQVERSIDKEVFGTKIGLTASLFGCWHVKLTRPFMDGKFAYQSCLNCGARKPFNPKTLKSYGSFYFPKVLQNQENQ